MIVFIGALLGILTGGLIAWRRKGSKADIAQYAFVFFLIFSLAALILTLLVHRAAV